MATKWKRSKKSNGVQAKARRIVALTALERQLEKMNNAIIDAEQSLKDYKVPKEKEVFTEVFKERHIKSLKASIGEYYPKKISRIKKEIEILKKRI